MKSTRRLCLRLWKRSKLVRIFNRAISCHELMLTSWSQSSLTLLLDLIYFIVIYVNGCYYYNNNCYYFFPCFYIVGFDFAELMILGFLSLLLTFGQSYIVRICIPTDIADKLLPCPLAGTEEESSSEEEHHRRLLSYDRRYLSDHAAPYQCKKEVTGFPR